MAIIEDKMAEKRILFKNGNILKMAASITDSGDEDEAEVTQET